jgi:hypothetical protein
LSRRLTNIARRFLADRRGAIAAMTALLSTTLIGFAGIGAETAFWYAQKRQLQTQADAAALAGAFELLQDHSSADANSNAQSWTITDAVANGFVNSAPNSIDASGCTKTKQADGSMQCRVVLSVQRSTLLASLYLPNITIRAQAEADLKPFDHIACMIALGTASGVISFTASSTFSDSNCTLSAPNSTSVTSIQLSNNSVTADTIWTKGGYSANATLTLNRLPITYSPNAPPDPWASTPPSVSPAAGSGSPLPCVRGVSVLNLPPGTYPALTFGPGNGNGSACNAVSDVRFAPGIYYLKGVDNDGGNSALAVKKQNGNGQSLTISCPTCGCTTNGTGSGVTIVAVPDNSGKVGGFTIDAGATVNLCASGGDATGGAIKGLLFYQCNASNASCAGANPLGDLSIPTSGPANASACSTVPAGIVCLAGVMYVPSRNASFPNPNGQANTDTLNLSCVVIVAQTISLDGHANFNSSGTSCVNAGVGVQKSYQVVLTQ